MRCFLISGSIIAVKRVMEDRQTRVTDTVETLMAWKKRIQCRATMLPIKKKDKNCFFETFRLVLLSLK
ncbi:hypothetical protein D3C72_2512380 [compost metagenome]